MSSSGAVVLAAAYLMPLVYLTWSCFYGKVSPADPWRAKGLEWRTSSPPPKRNFLHTPIVTDEPYDYHGPDTAPNRMRARSTWPERRCVSPRVVRVAAMTDLAGAVRVAPDPLREPWSELARQREAATFGMWLFLMSEMLFFGALFMAFSFSRAFSPAAFMEGARHTEIAYGAANTVVLVTSSLTVTLAVRAADIGRARLAAIFLAGTATLGLLFLVIKGFEYRDDLRHHLFPGAGFALGQNAAQVFWAFYWAMTGIHAIHLAIGIALVLRLSGSARRWRISATSPQFEVVSLYWYLGRRLLARSVSGSLCGGALMSETAAPRGLQWLGPLVAWTRSCAASQR